MTAVMARQISKSAVLPWRSVDALQNAINTGPRTEQSKIDACLSCPFGDCWNCLSAGKGRRTK